MKASTVKATIRFDGTPFVGWQVQPNGRSVQGEIERVLALIMREPVPVQGSGRTDAGVHALGLVISFRLNAEMDLNRLRRSINGLLSPEIRVESMEWADDSFSARYDAKWKTYAYSFQLGRAPDPFSARYTWCIPWELDVARMGKLAQSFLGGHDFAGLQCAGASVSTTERNVYKIEIIDGPAIGPRDATDHWRLEITGDGFLYKMVRNIVGTLVDVTRGNLPESRIGELLSSAGPYRGYTAPSLGLALVRVGYEAQNK
jgi:tRNA pseudouridine38-40 synthase